MLMEEEEEEEGGREGGRRLFLGRKTPRIYNRLTFVNTIAQVLLACGYRREDTNSSLLSPLPLPRQPQPRTQQPGHNPHRAAGGPLSKRDEDAPTAVCRLEVNGTSNRPAHKGGRTQPIDDQDALADQASAAQWPVRPRSAGTAARPPGSTGWLRG